MKTTLKTLSPFGKLPIRLNLRLHALVPLSICAIALSAALPTVSAQDAPRRSPHSAPLSAQDEALKDAVAKAVLANPSRAAEIVADAIAKNDLDKASVIADAVGQLFLLHPAVAEQAPSIAVAIAKAIYVKSGSQDARATATGAALSILAYHFAPHDPANHERIILTAGAGITVNPQLDYTAQVYQIVTQTLSSLGAPTSLLDNLEAQVLSGIPNASIRQQIAAIAQAPGTPQLPQIASGQILVTETKVDNR